MAVDENTASTNKKETSQAKSKLKRRNVAIFLDGTWNTPEDRTNVYDLFHQAVGPDARDASPNAPHITNAQQIRYYDEGVGTALGNLVRGGVGGRGVTKNITEAYTFLCKHHRPGDEIYIFGFSRGAYTARSLVGLISAAGLLPEQEITSSNIARAIRVYTTRVKETDGKDTEDNETARNRLFKEFRQDYPTKNIRIKFLGVWDTVGALGIPNLGRSIPSRRAFLEMHDTKMSVIVDEAYHALAIDEHRKIFQHTPWTKTYDEQFVEQVWFVGAHANVGGGYRDNRLHEISRSWMKSKAHGERGDGLQFYHLGNEFDEDLLLEPVLDSHKDFAFGLYKSVSKKYYRTIDLAGTHSVNERVHPSVWRYIEANPEYQPPNLPIDAKPKEE